MKDLFINSPPWVAWGFTGSAVATLWANFALTSVRNAADVRFQRVQLSSWL